MTSKPTPPPEGGSLPESDPPDEVDEYTLILLTRPMDAPELEDAEAALLQRQHLGHLDRMRESGAMLAAGPVEHQVDESWRGLCIYGVAIDVALELSRHDPAVRRGRVAPVALTWKTRRGAIRIHG
jgi:uncharacterized protein